jgi:hypothetical protein
MMAVMTLLGEHTQWQDIKRVISKPSFKENLLNFDKDNIPQRSLVKVQKLTRMEAFNE